MPSKDYKRKLAMRATITKARDNDSNNGNLFYNLLYFYIYYIFR